MTAGYKWRPLQRAIAKPPSPTLIQTWMEHHNCSHEEALARMEADRANTELWRNDLYQVEIRRLPHDLVHLNIRRLDGFPGRDWRHFQQIKNELVGPECEGLEIYPAESRLVDTTNKYHLFVFADPTVRIPFGFVDRQVQFDSHDEGGLRQRPPMKVAQR